MSTEAAAAKAAAAASGLNAGWSAGTLIALAVDFSAARKDFFAAAQREHFSQRGGARRMPLSEPPEAERAASGKQWRNCGSLKGVN
ncbi:hypothetical protein HPB50_014763 [Hyalomma asiaticum]|uniref:Uncharacterized protein n=1 Tax=Hyalomma asiaticum TaxID=266040 RepID=A0ACB7TI22_HYAAI|nr:hypothetical protein HPB50_014763 [Hyalomma asiaticum]